MAKHNSKFIEIKGARVHNLKNIDLRIPRNKFIVVTGVSGSGKSTLAFDTLYAEGQRRYVESLSSYARQFLGRINKPEADFIRGIPPAIAIEQKVTTRNPRSTVGTSTEVYDYLKLLYARVGKTYSPVSGKVVIKHSVKDVLENISSYPERTRMLLLADVPVNKKEAFTDRLNILLQQGFSRVFFNDEVKDIGDLIAEGVKGKHEFATLVVDRVSAVPFEEALNRYSDSIQTAFYEGMGRCKVLVQSDKDDEIHYFSNLFEADGMVFTEPNDQMFSFNSPIGACPKCEGYGNVIGIDEDLVVPNKSLSLYDDAVVCWRGETTSKWKMQVISGAMDTGFPVHKPYSELTEEHKKQLWQGTKEFKGIDAFFEKLEKKIYKIQNRVMISRYRGKTVCPDCKGTRLGNGASYVKIGGKSISDLVTMPIFELLDFVQNVDFQEHEIKVAKRIIDEITNRLEYLLDVGLSYLTLNRLSSTLSGGESQRINLATSLGNCLTGSLYILDEPSIGLHPRDTKRLITVLKSLRNLGNSVIVVEHEEEIIKAADEVIDVGPFAGRNGGEIIFQGTQEQLKADTKSLTGQFLYGDKRLGRLLPERTWRNALQLKGARQNNLKNVNVTIPLNALTVVTGVSGSGKSSLITTTLYPALARMFGEYGEKAGDHDEVSGDINQISKVEMVNQNPIGKSSRSNPVTYLKAYDEIRKLYSEQKRAKTYRFKPSHFSFNVDGGRCEECQGEGIIKVEMQFMADMELECEVCKGKRFKNEVLEVKYNGNNISDVLNMTVNYAIKFFSEDDDSYARKIVKKLKPLQDVGLGYVTLGQSSSTLSGGESQRVKLASFLSKEKSGEHILFIFDEPTTGLHFYDIEKLMTSLNALIEKGHTVLVIEHNTDVIKNADHIIDIGPEGGDKGGNIVYEGTIEGIKECAESYTGKYLIGCS